MTNFETLIKNTSNSAICVKNTMKNNFFPRKRGEYLRNDSSSLVLIDRKLNFIQILLNEQN